MTLNDALGLIGPTAAFVAAVVVVKAAWRTNSAKVWREEAEAQKARGDRLEAQLEEINARLTRIEDENKRLIALLSALDPGSVTPRRT